MDYDEPTILEKLRLQIDNTDNEIMFLIKRRFQSIKKVAKYKLEHNLEIEDLDREDAVMLDKTRKSITMDLNESFIREVFEIILTESKIQQRDFIEKKQNKK
jgi:chorismate mutase